MAFTSAVDSSSISLHGRKSQVFVEIPPSPLFKARVAPTLSKVDDLSAFHIPNSHKENAPPLSSKTINNIPNDDKNKGKRKAQDGDNRATLPGAKKAKIPQENSKNEVVACHQCRSKKPSSFVLQCTGTSRMTGNRCKAYYCNTCLRNRYGKELRIITKRKSLESRKDSDTEYQFICPRCDGNCNCAPCRKRRGLAPIGKFSVQNGEIVREMLERNPEALGPLPKHIVAPASEVSKLSKLDVSTKSVDAPEDTTKGFAKLSSNKQDTTVDPVPKKKLKVAPEPVWVSVPHKWSKHGIENRIHLREFVLRFNTILNISLRNIEGLDDFTSLHDPLTKAILLSLLDLLAIEDDIQKKKIQEAVKIIRSLGLNWAKIVPVLYNLRNSMPRSHALSAVPDLYLSDSETPYTMRGVRMTGVSANQLLPVLLYLIQVAGEGPSVRHELEEGYKQAKKVRAAYFKATREETERWSVKRAELIEEKPGAEIKTKESTDAWKVKFRNAEAEHKAIIAHIQHSHKPEIDCCAPRFTSLGRDTDGRTYYALSASGSQQGKKVHLPSESERFAFKKWGWFIAVYGKPGTVIQHGSDDVADEDESNDERWWGFADVSEMRKLSKWLAYSAEAGMFNNRVGGTKSINYSAEATATPSTLTSRLPSPSGTTARSRFESRPLSPRSYSDSRSDDIHIGHDYDRNLLKPVTLTEMKALAKAVLEFADFIDWRLNWDHTCKRKGSDAVTPAKFYD